MPLRRPVGAGRHIRRVEECGLRGGPRAGGRGSRRTRAPRGGPDTADPPLPPHRQGTGRAGRGRGRQHRRPAALPPRLRPVAAHPDGPARRPGRHIPPGLNHSRRRPPGRPPPVPGRSPRRRHDPPRRANRGDRKAGTRRRQDGLLTAALEAARRAAPRNGPRPGHRRGAVETRPQDAAPHRGGAAGPGTGRGPRRTRGRGVAPRRIRSPREPPQRPGTAGPRGRAARGGRPHAGGPTRRRRPGRRPRSARPSQTRREARPRPYLRLALAAPHGACEPDGRLRAPRVPASQPPRRVRPRDPAHRRERTTRPHRPGRGAPGP